MIQALIQQRHMGAGKLVVQALIPFKLLNNVALFTCKANPKQNEEYSAIVKENYEYYQRRIIDKRIADIEEYIKQCILSEDKGYSITALFPTSLILAFNEDDGNQVNLSGDSCSIDLNTNVFIVDGQHRMMAMKTLYAKLKQSLFLNRDEQVVLEFLETYRFNCVLLVNYDLWEQSQVFVNVNFQQKSVNRSLYYEVFGSQYDANPEKWKQNHIYLAHNLTKVLNEKEMSPYYRKIKMLGTGEGYVSQAFFVEALMRQFSLNGAWSVYKKVKDGNDDVKYMAVELLSYFAAVKDVFKSYWPSEYETKGTIICKTTGTGAFVRLLADMRKHAPENAITSLYKDNVSISDQYYKFVKSRLSSIKTEKADYLFGKKSAFSGSSGKGSEVKMYKELRSAIFGEPLVSDREQSKIPVMEIAEQLQAYYWMNQESDLDCLAYRYEFDDLSNLRVEEYECKEETISCRVKFDSGITIFSDNEDVIGFSMSFPSEASLVMKKTENKWVLEESSVKSRFDTSKYYS